MVPLKMIRQRYVLADSVYGISIEVESQPQQAEDGRADHHHQRPGPSPLSTPPNSPLCASSTASRSILWRHRAENFLWLASAAFIIYYGDFRSNFFSLLLNDPRVRRTPLHLGSACLVFVLGIFLYLAVRLRTMDRIEERSDVVAPGALPAATVVGLVAFILFSVALWPIWNILTVPMLFTLFMAFVVVAPYLPPSVNVTVDADSLRCLLQPVTISSWARPTLNLQNFVWRAGSSTLN